MHKHPIELGLKVQLYSICNIVEGTLISFGQRCVGLLKGLSTLVKGVCGADLVSSFVACVDTASSLLCLSLPRVLKHIWGQTSFS